MNYLKLKGQLEGFLSRYQINTLEVPDALTIVTTNLINSKSSQTVKSTVNYINRDKESVIPFYSVTNGFLTGVAADAVDLKDGEVLIITVATTSFHDAQKILSDIKKFIETL